MSIESRKVALVTGCSEPHSLGAALSLDLLRRGFRVFATARSIKTLAPLQAKGCDILELDVADTASAEAAAKVVRETCGRLDLLINNAGVNGFASALNTDLDALQQMYNINAVGPLRVTQAFAELLVKTANSTTLGVGRTVVVNIGSTARWGTPWQVGYAGSKHITSTVMRLELDKLGVKVIDAELALTGGTAMVLGTKDFPVSGPHPDKFYHNWSEIDKTYHDGLIEHVEKAPSVSSSVKTILDAATAKHVPRAVYAGAGAGLFKWVVPYLPTSV
ncbi:hypothetical protein EHS25_005020 [Saitozyma podzolica]|uniref:Uncharacterized protein n=1 Tax=Saitozyma podzolica TaxID=1890683 RepID=A0A427Y2F9_9TREE|nr:hypothetical protein EHS25_005020 [Saitozyma podzolica]